MILLLGSAKEWVRLLDLSNERIAFSVQFRRRLPHEHPVLCRFVGKEHAEGRSQKRPHHPRNENQNQNRRRRFITACRVYFPFQNLL